MTLYNLTALGDINGISDLFVYANSSANNLLGGMFVIALFLILIMRFRSAIEDRLIVASWICFLVSLIFSFIGILSLMYVVVFLLIGAGIAGYKVTTKKETY